MTTAAPTSPLKLILDALAPELHTLIDRARCEFVARFGAWVAGSHKQALEDLFLRAGRAKVACFLATTPEEAQEQHDIFETEVESIEVLGLAIQIMGEAEARAFLKAEIRAVLEVIPIAAGIAVKIALPVAFPVIGSLVGAPAGSGVEWLLNKFVKAVEPT